MVSGDDKLLCPYPVSPCFMLKLSLTETVKGPLSGGKEKVELRRSKACFLLHFFYLLQSDILFLA